MTKKRILTFIDILGFSAVIYVIYSFLFPFSMQNSINFINVDTSTIMSYFTSSNHFSWIISLFNVLITKGIPDLFQINSQIEIQKIFFSCSIIFLYTIDNNTHCTILK